MFEEGNILYFEPFHFDNGDKAKNKYFIVIKNLDDDTILCSLPTSKDHIPSDLDLHGGAYEIPERRLSAYMFPANTEVAVDASDTNKRFSFSKNTFIYGEQVILYPKSKFIKEQKNRETTITTIGTLYPEVFKTIKDFLHKSNTVKHKFKKML